MTKEVISLQKKQWLEEKIARLSGLVIGEVGEGYINDKSFSKYGFRWSFQGVKDAYLKNFGEKIETEDLFLLCKEYVISELKKRGVDESNAQKFASRNFDIKIKKTNYLNLETLTIEVAKFLKSGGSLKKIAVKDLPFYEMARSYARFKKGEKMDFVEVLAEVKEFYFANLSKFNKYSLSGLTQEDFSFEPRVEKVAVNIQNLTQEVCDYIRAGGKLYGVLAKSLPFFERARSYERYHTNAGEISLERAILEVKNYYFSMVAPNEKPEERLNENDFIYMSMYDFEKAKTREKHTRKLYEMARACADKNGEVSAVKDNPEWSEILSSLESGLTTLEFVALMFPVDENLHIKKGRVHSEKFTVVAKDLEAFVEKYGADNLVENIKRNDKILYKRLHNLSVSFPEGSISVSELLDVFGYLDDSQTWVSGDQIDETRTIEELRAVYESALSSYIENHPNASEVDMRAVNKLMDLRVSNPILYSRLYKLALRKGMMVKDYINGKELFAYDSILADDGKIKRAKKQSNGQISPALTYEIGLGSNRHTKFVIENGKEYTKYLKRKLVEAMFENEILNDPNLPNEMKVNERFKLAQAIVEEVVDEVKMDEESSNS